MGVAPIFQGAVVGIEVIMDLGEVRIPYDPVKDRKARGEILHDWASETRTHVCRCQRPVPYHLAMTHYLKIHSQTQKRRINIRN